MGPNQRRWLVELESEKHRSAFGPAMHRLGNYYNCFGIACKCFAREPPVLLFGLYLYEGNYSRPPACVLEAMNFTYRGVKLLQELQQRHYLHDLAGYVRPNPEFFFKQES